MKFKRLEIFGFKSFANKIEVNIDNGIIAIIGPNGCGKSNFADAIRWVLGEQSAKTLRGGNMQDVIFSGTEKKKALSYCEVTLFFSEIEAEFGLPYTEMAISRRLYRSGESIYLLNNSKVRLKDIVEKLHILGIGREGYSIIGQGKVEEIMNSKPIDRRAVFEEATGIAHFRVRKNEIERKLETTDTNLSVFNNIISEIERQIGPLEKEAVRAEKWQQINEDLKKHELNIYYAKKQETAQRVKELTESLEFITDDLANKRISKDKYIEKRDAYNSKLDEIDIELKELNAKAISMSGDEQKIIGEVNMLRQRIEQLELNNNDLESEIDDCKFSIADYSKRINEFEKQKAELEQDDISYKADYEKYEKELKELNEKMLSYDSELRNSQSNILSSATQLADVKANLSEYKTKKVLMSEQLVKEKNNLKNGQAEQGNIKNSIDLWQKQVAELKQKRTTYLNDAIKAKTANDELKIKYEKYEVERQSLANILTKLNTEFNMYTQMVNNYEGLAYAVKRLTQDADSDKGLAQKIIGNVATSMKVEEKLETAIITALGAAINNVITSDKQTGKFLIEYLKQKKYGRATFLPLDTIKPRTVDMRYDFAFKMPGCLGVASDLISYDKKLDNIYKGLLGSTLIVDTLQNAINISSRCDSKVRIVTLDGDEIAISGAMSGGSRKSGNDANVVSYQRLLNETEKTLNEKQDELKDILSSLESTKVELNVNNKIIEENKSKINEIDIEISTLNTKITDSGTRLATVLEQVKLLSKEIDEKQKALMILENDINMVENLNANLSSERNASSSTIREKQKAFDELTKKYNSANTQMTLVRTSLATTRERLVAVNDNIDGLKTQIVFYDNRIEANLKKIDDNKLIIVESTKQFPVSNGKKVDIEEINNIKASIIALDKQKSEIRAEMLVIDKDIEALSDRITDLTERKTKDSARMESIIENFNTLGENTKAKYEAMFDGEFEEGVLRYVVNDYDLKEGMQIAATCRKQQSAMGSNINFRAAEQIIEQRQRLSENTKQRDDLQQAKDDILNILKDVTNEMTIRFNEGFAKIQENFTTIFRTLFGGGGARLILEKSETGDPLDEGVDIEAQPPGKSLKRLSLLSGGEKALTAIAILFSMLSLNPMPFCVLDEIEAALDESNVERFARYLKNYSKETQFIVITHRKPTMENADVLYGVTMEQGSGISKVLSVTLKDAVENYVDDSMAKAETQLEAQ